MKRYPGKYALAAVSLACLLILAACNCAPTLRYITVSPQTATIAVGATQAFTAKAYYSDGTIQDVSSQVSWGSSSSAVASITSVGVATGLTAGTSSISATLTGISATPATLTVTNSTEPVPVGLQITPTNPSIPVGGAENFAALEVWSDESLHTPPAGSITWTSSDTSKAPIIAGSGIATGLAAGPTTITATESTTTFTASTALTVVTGVTNFAYVSNIGDDTVQWYTVTAGNATPLVSAGTVSTANLSPVQTVLHPAGVFLYVLESDSGANQTKIFVYTIDPNTGQPTATSLPFTTAGQSNSNLGVVDPYGRFLYVIDSGDATTTLGGLYAFSIDPGTGALTQIGSGPITTGLDYPDGIVVDRTGSFVYVANGGLNGTANANKLNGYSIDQSTGALTALSAAGTGTNPAFVAIDPPGTHLYVANNGDGSVSGFAVNTGTGALTPFSGGPTTVTGANSVLNLVVDPTDKYLYILDAGNSATNPVTAGQVYGYLLNSDGTLPASPISGTPQPAGGVPTGIAIDATGKLLAVDNSNDSDVSLYTVGSGGAITPTTPPTVAAGTIDQLITFYNASVAPSAGNVKGGSKK